MGWVEDYGMVYQNIEKINHTRKKTIKYTTNKRGI